MARTPRKKKETSAAVATDGIVISEPAAFDKLPRQTNLGPVATAIDVLQVGTMITITGVDYKKLSTAATSARKRAKEKGEIVKFSVRVLDKADLSKGIGIFRIA